MHVPYQPEFDDNPLSKSSAKLPDTVPEVKSKTFVPPRHQRGEGNPSAKLRRHIGVGAGRRGSTFNALTMMLHLFMFFLTLPVLAVIARFTNSKAYEVVNKVKCTGKNGHVYYKVIV